MAIGRMFTIAANVARPRRVLRRRRGDRHRRRVPDRFVERVRTATQLRDEQAKVVTFAVVPDLDMAGARGSALAARRAIRRANP